MLASICSWSKSLATQFSRNCSYCVRKMWPSQPSGTLLNLKRNIWLLLSLRADSNGTELSKGGVVENVQHTCVSRERGKVFVGVMGRRMSCHVMSIHFVFAHLECLVNQGDPNAGKQQ